MQPKNEFICARHSDSQQGANYGCRLGGGAKLYGVFLLTSASVSRAFEFEIGKQDE